MAKNRRLYYTMGQVSEMFDLPASTIRFWEKRFKILAPRKNAKGNRLFTPADVENLKLIYHLTKEKKMTLSGAETFMMQRRTAAKGEMSMVEILQKIRTTLVEIRQEIETAEKQTSDEIVIRGEQIDTEMMPIAEMVDVFTSNKSIETIDDQTNTTERIEDDIPLNDDGLPRFQQLSLF